METLKTFFAIILATQIVTFGLMLIVYAGLWYVTMERPALDWTVIRAFHALITCLGVLLFCLALLEKVSPTNPKETSA